jgi:hypothetical protein
VTEYFSHSKSPSDANHNFIYDFSKYMLNSYHSNYYWNKAERLTREEPLKSKQTKKKKEEFYMKKILFRIR